jgi:V/A-type H+-transporting ATPase subunit D
MILAVNPNRMELLRLRKRLSLAIRGHKLLQDKLEEMMRRFTLLLKDIDKAREDFSRRNKDILEDLLYCRITTPQEAFAESLTQIKSRLELSVQTQRIMNVKVPLFEIKELNIEKNYNFFQTSAQMDLVVAGAKDYIASLLKLAQLFKALNILAGEIERTRRRVNALEYRLIPSIQETIRYITQKLNEFERANLVRLMRVKEIVRSH